MRISLENLSYWFIALVAFFLPIKTTWSNTALIILLILTAFELIRKGGKWNLVSKRSFYLNTSIVLVIPLILGLLYTADINKGIAQILKSVFYLLTPIILFRKDIKRLPAIQSFGWGLVIGGFLSLTYLFFHSSLLTRFMDGGVQSVLSYGAMGKEFLSVIPEMHPVYYGSYLVVALGFIWLRPLPLNRIGKSVLTVFFVVGIIFLNSRIVFLVAGLLMVYTIIVKVKLKYWIPIGAFLLMGLYLLYPYYSQTYFYNKLRHGTAWELQENINKSNTDVDRKADSRMSRWLVSLELIRESPIIGHGTGSARVLLKESYQRNAMPISLSQEYDSHNQFLGYGIEFGLVGFTVLLWYFGYNTKRAIMKREVMAAFFFLSIFLFCLTENYLIRNMGINFVVVMGTLFYLENDA